MFLKVAGSRIGEERVQTINARNLWQWLEIKNKFSDWIKQRIEDGQFDENKDYITFRQVSKRESGSNLATVSIEYHLTLDMAKHLAMLEKNSKGKQAREYFISCEYTLDKLKEEIKQIKQGIFNLENEPLSLTGYQQLSLKDRKKQRSQIWEIWRRTNAIAPELNYRRIQVAKEVNLIINGITSYRFRQLTGTYGLVRDWFPIANQYAFYLAEHDLLDLLRKKNFNINFQYIENTYPQLARIARERVEIIYENPLTINIEEVVQEALEYARSNAHSSITPYIQTEGQILEFQHKLVDEIERLEDLLSEESAKRVQDIHIPYTL